MTPSDDSYPYRLTRPRSGIALVPGQIRYQLLLLARSPMVPFISIVIPLMLLVALDLVTPEMTLRSLGNEPVAEFLTPAMGSFAVLNAGFVNVVIGMTLSRHAKLPTSAIPSLAGTFAAGLVASCAMGMAVSGLIRSSEAALPLAYAVLLPISFISQVFFPAPTETAWLHRFAAVLPVAPFANAMEGAFLPVAHGLSASQLLVLLSWGLGGFVLALVDFRWEPRQEPLIETMVPARIRSALSRSAGGRR